jgi:hypothetical protein
MVKDFGLENLFSQLADLNLTGKLVFLPNNLEFYFNRGDLIAAQGGELLGSILLRLGAISVAQLSEALSNQESRSLGEVLSSQPYGIDSHLLEDALYIQILRAVLSLFETVPEQFAVYDAQTALPIETRLPVQIALAEVVPSLEHSQTENFSPESVVRLLPHLPHSAVVLEPEQWAVATLLDGRRSLETVTRLYQIQFPRRDNPSKRVFAAVLQLHDLGLVEVVQFWLQRVLLKMRSGGQVAQLQQQFLSLATGQRNLQDISEALGLDPTQSAEMAVQLYRGRRLEVQRGVLEFERLLEHF